MIMERENDGPSNDALIRIALAERVIPRREGKAIVVGFKEDPLDDPFVMILEATPEDFRESLAAVVALFVLKGIRSYVLCLEVCSKRVPKGTPESAVNFDQYTENALMFMLNMGDGKGEKFFIVRDEAPGDVVTMKDMGNNHPFVVFANLAPGDESRELAEKRVSEFPDEDKKGILDMWDAMSIKSSMKTVKVDMKNLGDRPSTSATVH